MVLWTCFIFIPIPGKKWSNLNILQMSWFNHQLEKGLTLPLEVIDCWPHRMCVWNIRFSAKALHGVQQLHLDSNRSIRGSERRRQDRFQLLSIWIMFRLKFVWKTMGLECWSHLIWMFGIFWHSCWFRLIGFTAYDQKCHHSHHYSWVVATQIFLMFTPKIGEMIQFDKYLADGLVQPATR